MIKEQKLCKYCLGHLTAHFPSLAFETAHNSFIQDKKKRGYVLKLIQDRNEAVTLCIGSNHPQNIALLQKLESPEDDEMSACSWK